MTILDDQVARAGSLNAAPFPYVPEINTTQGDFQLVDGIATGWYHRIGRVVVGEAAFIFTTDTIFGGGAFLITLPEPLQPGQHVSGGLGIASAIGSAIGVDVSTNPDTLYTGGLYVGSVGGNYAHLVGTGAAGNWDFDTPFVWANGDVLKVTFEYLTAPA